jgi:hypothetical protein
MKKLPGPTSCVAALAAILLSAGCASTSSIAPPQGIFEGKTVAEVQGKLVALCLQRGYRVSESTTTYVVCEKEASAGDDLASRAFVVGADGTTPVKRVHFYMAAVTEGVRVTPALVL